MKLKVHLSPLGTGLTKDDTIDLYCGAGKQILKWLGYAACARLAYSRGNVCGSYLPQAILNRDGQSLDIYLVLKESFSDGDELYVEYACGPTAYRVRWEGRPKSPPFQWGPDGEVKPSTDSWLVALDLEREGLATLVLSDMVGQDPSSTDQDLTKVKEAITQHGGALQMLFFHYSCEGITSADLINRMTLPQFRQLMQVARVVSPQFPVEKLDEIFTAVATSEQTLSRKMEGNTSTSSFTLVDFMIALIHVAFHKFTAEAFTRPSNTPLSTKLLSLLQDCFVTHLYPDLQRKVEKLHHGLTTGALALLRKGRRLTEQTLESCQFRRVKSDVLRVDLEHICRHLQRWALLGREFTLQELATIAVFATQTSSDPEQYVLRPVPLSCDYDEFERLMLGMSYLMYSTKKKHEPFEEFLGETLDYVYKKANVLVMANKEAKDESP